MSEWGWFAVAAVGVSAVCLAVSLAFARRSGGRAVAPRREDDSKDDLVLGDMTEALAKGMPGEARDKEEVLPQLTRAGFYSRSALIQYRAVRAVLVLAPLFAAASVALLVPDRQIPYVAIGGLVVAVVGFSIPRLYVAIKAQNRAREIERGLPVFADMMSLALIAGQGLMTGMRRVGGQLRGPFPRMAEELDLVSRQAELLNLAVAFDNWAARSQLPEVRNLAVILNQSSRLGNDVSAALLEYSAALRVASRQRAEARAQRASFWMLFPTLFCLWLPAAVLLIGPMFFEFSARRAKARDAMPKADPNGPAAKVFNRKGTVGFKDDGPGPK